MLRPALQLDTKKATRGLCSVKPCVVREYAASFSSILPVCYFFIDFSAAFDSLWRAGLWHKLKQTGFDGKLMQIVKNMYQNIKSRVKANGQQSPIFSSEIGVRPLANLIFLVP